MQRSKTLSFIIAALTSLTGFPGRAADAPIIDVKMLKRGLLDVKVEQQQCGEANFVVTPLVLGVIPPLIEAGLAQAGQLLVEASGKYDTS
jgi:hypothetical protein